jgi:hypothetical protein
MGAMNFKVLSLSPLKLLIAVLSQKATPLKSIGLGRIFGETHLKNPLYTGHCTENLPLSSYTLCHHLAPPHPVM